MFYTNEVTLHTWDLATATGQQPRWDPQVLQVSFDSIVPMLPEKISNDLCSLREKEERPALACFMSFDKSGRKTKHRFERVIMRSAAKLAYEEAQAAIDGKPNDKTDPLLERVLKPLWAAYAILLKGRNAREPLELDLPERRLVFLVLPTPCVFTSLVPRYLSKSAPKKFKKKTDPK